ncbi:hypothetical protein R1sor_006755 [Riccia sorocarpa]|uniref:Reverse transcriptase domain-containing protein n=1 Tax=Riccia sorocarpa TaxID=122646 RepID=A0ABD3HRZ6_9MARC
MHKKCRSAGRQELFLWGFLEGIITLVPKEGGVETLSRWRPITLLSSVHKVYAKVIACRLTLILPTLVPSQQQGFIKGRNVYNNVMFFSLLHETLKRERRLASFLMLDLAKVFDPIRHDFIFLGLETLGFSRHFLQIIKSIVEEVETDERRLLRVSLRAGRETLPITLAVADDTAFVLTTDQNFFASLGLLFDRFSSVSGCMVNWGKSRHLPFGKFILQPPWLCELPFQSLSRSQGTRYLGVFTASKLKPNNTWDFVSQKLTKRLAIFANQQLKFKSKVVILRYLLQSIISFSLALVRFRKKYLQRLERLLAAFLWGTRADGSARTSLAIWEQLALPVGLCGVGLWSLQLFQEALVYAGLGCMISGVLQN